MSNIWKDGVMGLVVADALGVPVEFMDREMLKIDPVVDMRGYGCYDQPPGSWSDDSSMTLASVDSLKSCGEVDYKDMMERFCRWRYDGEYLPYGVFFDIGISCQNALMQYGLGTELMKCADRDEYSNGNGALMRILPVCLFMYEKQKKVCTSDCEAIFAVHQASALTHGHLRSQIACGIYFFLVKAILDRKGSLQERLQEGIDDAFDFYNQDSANRTELAHFYRMRDLTEFREAPEDTIISSGYVVSTFEAAIWCLLNTDSYKASALKAVNLGRDTDTVAAIMGGLAGLYYGYEAIPEEWLAVIGRREWIEEMLSR